MKQIFVWIGAVGVIIISFSLVVFSNNRSTELPFYKIDWSDHAHLNSQVSSMVFNIQPFFMNSVLNPKWDLTDAFMFFEQNIEFLGDERGFYDFEVVLEFSNLTGNEPFLSGNSSNSNLSLSFYVDFSLANEALELLSYVERENTVEQGNNSIMPVQVVPLTSLDWDRIFEDYESYVVLISLERMYAGMIREDLLTDPDFVRILDVATFERGKDDINVILELLEQNKTLVSDNQTNEFPFAGSIRLSPEFSRNEIVSARFFMNEELARDISNYIGEDEWVMARDRWR